MSIREVFNIEDSAALKLPAGLYTPRDYVGGKHPFAIIYPDRKGGFKLSVGGVIPRLKSKIVVN